LQKEKFMIENHSEKVLVSVLMTSYNREKYIAEAIESVLNQTYTNFELIIVDDCSKDKTLEIAKKFEEKDHRIKVYLNEKNLGDYPNRNKAASYANGEYIKYVDSDDVLYPHGLDVMVRAMQTYPNAGFASCRPQSDSVLFPIISLPHDTYYEHFFMSDIFGRSPLGLIIKRNVFESLGGFVTDKFQVIGDSEFLYRIAAQHSMVKMVMGLGHWRSHDNQVTSIEQTYYKQITNNYFLAKQSLDNKNCPLKGEFKLKAFRKAKWNLARSILKLIKMKKFRIAINLYKESDLVLFDFLKALRKFR